MLTIPLEDVPDQGLTGLNIPDFVDRVIIGPTPYWQPLHGALWESLTAWFYLGKTDKAKKVWTESSGIGSFEMPPSVPVAVGQGLDVASLPGKTIKTMSPNVTGADSRSAPYPQASAPKLAPG
jgi:hypothetical protein